MYLHNNLYTLPKVFTLFSTWYQN